MLKYLLAIFIGGLIGVLFCNWHYFTFDSNFKWADLFSVAITSFIGLHIAEKISEKQSASRSEKDFFICEIKEFRSELTKLKTFNDTGSISFENAKAIFRDLNHDIVHLKELSQLSTTCRSISFAKLQKEFSSIRNLITGISPINNTINIPTDVKNEVDDKLNNIKKYLYELITAINTLHK